MKNVLITLCLIAALFRNSQTFGDDEQIVGILMRSTATKGGAGFDDCLGSPYFYLQADTNLAITKLRFLPKTEISWESWESLIGQRVRLEGSRIKKLVDGNKHWAPRNEEDAMLQRPVYPIVDGKPSYISCDYFEVLDFSKVD